MYCAPRVDAVQPLQGKPSHLMAYSKRPMVNLGPKQTLLCQSQKNATNVNTSIVAMANKKLSYWKF